MRPLRLPLLVVAIALQASVAGAAVRLTYPMSGAPTTLFWPSSSFPISYRTDARVAASVGQATVDRAFEAWSQVAGASLHFTSAGQLQAVGAGKDDANTISFVDGLFRDQGFVAVTTYWNDDSGRMTEADIQLDAAYVGSMYPAQQTLEHEIGHLLGLDHSGVISSVMYPFVSASQSTELDTDDRISIANLYPRVDPTLVGATLTGRVVGNEGGVFAAQVVAVNEAGVPVAAGLTEAGGDFSMEAIPPGTYRLYAEPLDGPVRPQNLAGVYRDAKVTAFPTRFLAGAPIRVDAGKVYGNLNIDAVGAPATLNAKWIGVAEANSSAFSLYSTVVALTPGQVAAIAVGGDGFTGGMTTFSILNPSIRRVSDFRYAGNYIYANFEVAPDAHAGSAVVLVTSGNQTAALTGAVRIEVRQSPPRSRAVRR